jgi:hypothetical protein
VGFVVFGCVFAAHSAAKTQPNTTNYPPTEQLPFYYDTSKAGWSGIGLWVLFTCLL